ncbi:photoreceptor ankyrin repeat protein [Cuculus canorus]|uniref:photoreceptor ankyrin repeat protein n=1 Tax=Cuculus canorus TaxID=55661 RepID=UPI0023AAD606|nr:photoreceptor ankyrin repeat protein [Cuculus canorus]XP_053907264.1 photoreceptor ankyrin repeat protein [Cuculus canorus]
MLELTRFLCPLCVCTGGANNPRCLLTPPGEAPGPRQGSGPSWACSSRLGRMTDACGGGGRAAAPASSLDASDPELHYEEEDEDESESSDTVSICSDDSVYPCYEVSLGAGGTGDLSLYQCCARNDAKLVQERLEHGVTRSEAMELDANGRNALMVACYKGFVDIVPLLQKCPYINVNQQDKDGNTALMMAAQAGHITIVNYLLNYFPALEVDKRDPRGLTALMKAAVQGRQNCVAALLLAGADLQAMDPIKGKTAREWAVFTGRFETTVRIRSLLRRPRAEQFSTRYRPEWPALAELVAKALRPKSTGKRLSEKIKSMFTFSFPHDPEEDGVMDHMVRMTTSLASPFVATACQTVCPESPPEVGKHRLSVPEILGHHVLDPDAESETTSCLSTSASSCNGQAVSEIRLLPSRRQARGLLSFLPLWLRRGNIIFPGEPIPKIKVSKDSCPPAGSRERRKPKGDKNLLQPPKWKYKELQEEKKAAKEAKKEEKKKRGKHK